MTDNGMEASLHGPYGATRCFAWGSELAGEGRYEEAKLAFMEAVALDPAFHLARYQWGMLRLTLGEATEALAALAPLALVPDDHPHAFLKSFHRGVMHLARDEFDAALDAFGQGMAANVAIEALNRDVVLIIDAIEHLPGRGTASRRRAAATLMTAHAQGGMPTAPSDLATEPGTTDEVIAASASFGASLNAKTQPKAAPSTAAGDALHEASQAGALKESAEDASLKPEPELGDAGLAHLFISAYQKGVKH